MSGTRLLEPSRFSLGYAGLTTRGVQGRASPGEELREATSGKQGFRPSGWGAGKPEVQRNSKAGNAAPEAPLRGRRRFSRRETTRLLARERRDALGRRAAEGVPDSRAEAKGLGSAQRGERPGRGRRYLVVN